MTLKLSKPRITTVDWEGVLALVTHVHRCNFNCAYCYNKSIRDEESIELSIDSDELIEALEKVQDKVDYLVISGGEPTAQQIHPLLIRIGKLGYKIKLYTNGYHPTYLKYLIDNGLIHSVSMDVKAPLHLYSNIVGCMVLPVNIKRSITIIKEERITYEFRTVIWENCFNEEDYYRLARLLSGAGSHMLSSFYGSSVCFKAPSEETLQKFGKISKEFVEKVYINGNLY
jgi:pyruvate formate lyase activating enzyme